MRWQPKDIRGKRFGNLIVTEWVNRAVRIKKPSGLMVWNGRWRCQCDCGNTVLKRTTALNSKFGKSCGCIAAKTLKFSLLGERFGSLEVMSQAESINYPSTKNHKHNRTWICRCDCGKEIRLTTNALRQDRKKDCGCGKKPADMDRLNRGLKIHRVKQRIEVYNRMRKKLRTQNLTLLTSLSDYIQWKRSYNSFIVTVRCAERHEMKFTWARLQIDNECRICRKAKKLAAIHAESKEQRDVRLRVRRERAHWIRDSKLRYEQGKAQYQIHLQEKEIQRQRHQAELEKERILELERRDQIRKRLAVPSEPPPPETETVLPFGSARISGRLTG